MSKTNRVYETGGDFAAVSHGQIVSRSLFAVVERGDTPLDGGYGLEPAVPESKETVAPKPRFEFDFQVNPLASSPDAAAIGFAVMKGTVNKGLYREYFAES